MPRERAVTIWTRLWGWLQPGGTPSEPNDLVDDRLADGRVETLAVDGVEVAPNRTDPRFRRFVRRQGRLRQSLPACRHRTRTTPRLEGRVVWLSLFVGRDGTTWSDAEIALAHRALERAGVWIEQQAAHYAARVNIALPDTYFEARDEVVEEVAIGFVPEGEAVGPLEIDAELKAIASASRAAARLGFHDLADLVQQSAGWFESDAVVVLLHLRRAGRSIAIPEDISSLPGVQVAVCYAREASFPEPLVGVPFPDPVTMVHEFLHLFGASDKYGIPLSQFPRGQVTARDVMCLHYEALPRLRIDPLTAREVGWSVPAGPRR